MTTHIRVQSFFARCFILLAALLSFNGAVQAEDSPIYSNKKGAIKGTDPVAYFSLQPGEKAVRGSEEFVYEWKGATWKFANAENRQKFIDNPEKYAPQYGGYCAFAVSHDFTKSIDPNRWEIVDDKLYLNYNRTAYRKWKKDQLAAIERADANWPTVRTNCEKHNNCYDKY